jgi:deoxyribodipyrimidine photo-lyase
MQKINIFWFRRDLRFVDNAGLFHALNDALPVMPIFIFDKAILDKLDDPSDARITFIHNQVSCLDDIFRKNGTGLRTFYGEPLKVFEQLLSQFQIDAVFTNKDYEPYATNRDTLIEELLQKNGVRFYSFKDHVIFEKSEILNDQGQPYKVFTPYKRKWLEKLRTNKFEQFKSENHLDQLFNSSYPQVLQLDALGFHKTEIILPEANFDENILKEYHQNRDFPALKGTSKLGVHFRFGTISIRTAVLIAMETSDTWLSELIWREFYIMILSHFPHVEKRSFKPQYDSISWINDENQYQKWCDGKTGYPIVDAGMRELNATGFMHNRVRMITASFLTKHLLIDWRWGEAYFAKKLLDFDMASNNGGWQWAAGTGTDAQPYFRVFNPYSQQEKFDPDLTYIKHWVPEYGTFEYVLPIVPHKEARVRAINTYKEAVS